MLKTVGRVTQANTSQQGLAGCSSTSCSRKACSVLVESPITSASIVTYSTLRFLSPYTFRLVHHSSPSARTQIHKKPWSTLDPTVFNHPIRRDIPSPLRRTIPRLPPPRVCKHQNSRRSSRLGQEDSPSKGHGKEHVLEMLRVPMLRGGGIAFGPKPRDFSTKLPRKVIQMGMRVALSAKVKEQQFGVMFSMDWPEPKTKSLAKRLEDLGLDQTLFVTGEEEIPVTLERAIRNIPKVKLTTSNTLTVHELLKWRRIMLDAKAVDFFERTLSRTPSTVAH
ncbi:50S ribosomal protein L4 [Desarmillaria tabescens]|uniref:Large ribosomal subunit protein uL4m n=1 Tax=Armillaria tabescens TaxID=1929756 RepID=A0AA39U103_ARMTA|nr:50S ribosomal protein L4 [Desarmillaria tabescens]KAK0464880.1 50S ribosomal protein L4 [Desarmillaria tabescens]